VGMKNIFKKKSEEMRKGGMTQYLRRDFREVAPKERNNIISQEKIQRSGVKGEE
jgi:hypothetical protein